jgi:hypothetical protein
MKKWMFFVPLLGAILVLLYSDRIYDSKYNLNFTVLELGLIAPIAGISWGSLIMLILVSIFK